MHQITRLTLAAVIATLGACAPEPAVARFAGSFDPATGTLEFAGLDGDALDADLEQALFQKVEVDANDGIADNADEGTVEVRNGNGGAAPTVTTLAAAGADAAACGGVGTDAALVFGLRIYNNVADFTRTVVRMDTVTGGVNTFCHLAGRTNAPGLQHPRLASYEFGSLNIDTTSSQNQVGNAPVGRRIVARFSGVPSPFTFTGSIFADF